MDYAYEHLDWRELANRLSRDQRIDELFQQLMLVLNGDVEEAFRQLDRLSERYATTAAAHVMLIDVSHSMTLYGEDRIPPAKQVALAYAELLRRRYPRDSLNILLFGDDVREVSVGDLTTVTNGPFHTNTCE